jgi:hypothetical protein
MTDCPVKRFTPELIPVYEVSILKKLAWSTFDEIQSLENSPDIPACVRLFSKAILHDLETGRMDTLNHPEFRGLTVKLLENCCANTVCKR